MSSDTRVSRILCKKYRKISRKIAPDRISNLPDCVLSHILSLLPTKDAVRTSVLSKDWEYKWTSVCNIDINDKDQFSKKKSSKTSFAKFVEKLLLLTDDIDSFHFECQEKHGVGRLTTWIFSVLRRNIRCLKVVYGEPGIILPRKLLSCNSLENLELVLPCTFKVRERVCFGSLTTLHLEGVSILNENWIVDSVMFDFPVLVKFTIRKCKWLNVKRVEISAPKMTGFVIETPDGAVMNDYPIKITGQSLERFESYGGLPENIVLSGGSHVVSAALLNRATRDNFHLLEKTGLQVRELLNEFSNAYGLKLSFSVAYAIHLSTRLARAVSLPTFSNLEELVICGWAGALVELLHVTPSLKCLKINMRGLADYNYDDEEYVPSCFQSHLEEVKFESFSGSKHDFKLGKYLLENAAKLKKLFISNDNGYLIPKNKIAEELSTYSKVSTCLTVFVL